MARNQERAGLNDRRKVCKGTRLQLSKAPTMRKSLQSEMMYPIPYINPPTELRVAVHEARRRIVLRCERAGTIVFPAMEFGNDVDFELVLMLIRHRRGELGEGCPPEAFSYVNDLSARIGIQKHAVNRRIERLRDHLQEAIAENWPGAVFRFDMLIETNPGRGGYRLAPSVRPVAWERLIASSQPDGLTAHAPRHPRT